MKRFNSSGKPSQALQDRKKLFAGLNTFVSERGGWVTSIPGDPIVRIDVLPDSTIPGELGGLGYEVKRDSPPEGQRILAAAIEERLTLTSSGAFEPLVEG
jgi:hypothetical protein